MVFPVVVYVCKSWTIKKAERRRINAFELWCWEDPWSPLDCKEIQRVHPKGDQSWVFIGRTEVETPILWPPDSFEKTLMLGKIEGRRRRGSQRMRWMASLTQWTWVWVDSGSWWWIRRPGVLQFMGSQRVGHDWETDWTEALLMVMLLNIWKVEPFSSSSSTSQKKPVQLLQN